MPELRWILVGFAIVLLAGIYLWGRKASAEASKRDATSRTRPEPMFAHESQPFAEPAPTEDDEWQARAEQIEEGDVFHDEDRGRSPRGQDALTIERAVERDSRRGRVEPTFTDVSATAELPASAEPEHEPEGMQTSTLAANPNSAAPTLSSGDSPPPKRVERRKILSLRLSASPHRIDGARLKAAFEAEQLQHGKYAVYHRLHDDGTSIFSVASMVEPGTFESETMAETQYPGITLFAQLPGPVAGMHALNELVACARRLQQSLGGILQDERGVPLTVHRVERMRQEVREFERPTPTGARSSGSPTARL